MQACCLCYSRAASEATCVWPVGVYDLDQALPAYRFPRNVRGFDRVLLLSDAQEGQPQGDMHLHHCISRGRGVLQHVERVSRLLVYCVPRYLGVIMALKDAQLGNSQVTPEGSVLIGDRCNQNFFRILTYK